MAKDDFNLVNMPEECKDPSIKKDDFKLVQVDAKIHDQKFETKPTTFFKDCLKRFAKNKSSVVAGIILGILLLMSIFVPILFKTNEIHDTSKSHPDIYYLEPRLFKAGTGFWDGTKKMTDIAVDTSAGPEHKDEWGPDPKIYNKNAIMNLEIGEEQYTKTPNKYANGGYIQFGYFAAIPDSVDSVIYSTQLNVRELATTEVKPTIDDDPYAKENIVSIEKIYAPEKIEQLDTITVQDVTVDIKYKDVNDEDKIKEKKNLPVDSVTLDTSTIGKDIVGEIQVGILSDTFKIEVIEKQGVKYKFTDKLEITNFVTLDEAKLAASDEKTKTFPEGYTDAENALFLYFEQGLAPHSVPLTDYAKSHDVGGKEAKIDVKAKFDEYCLEHSITNEVSEIQLQVRVKNALNKQNSCTLIKSIEIKSDGHVKEKFESYSFTSGNDVYIRTKNDGGVWVNTSNSNYSKETNYLVKAVLCSFTYDTYEAVLGRVEKVIFIEELRKMANLGYIKLTMENAKDEYGNYAKDENGNYYLDKDKFECKILNEKKCPLAEEFTVDDVILDKETGIPDRVNCIVLRYKMDPYNLEEMPKFLLGTDKSGRDMFIYVFEGLRTSLLLGIITSAVCFVFGLIWGSISGYFGGAVDLAMERFTDILAGVPWIVVMTLTIIHLGSTFFTFALALCLTGWIGTSHTTRTQFYRFRGREYVLASRTLGASHGRLIARHILPNAMGTIITSAVLMVPSIIFSEATISYLGLGFKNLASLGVILSDNQVELTNHPYLLIFPAVIIALLMISFNLFGNGLRDAVNPSLKGEGE